MAKRPTRKKTPAKATKSTTAAGRKKRVKRPKTTSKQTANKEQRELLSALAAAEKRLAEEESARDRGEELISANWNVWGVTRKDCADAKAIVMRVIRGTFTGPGGDEDLKQEIAEIQRDYVKLLAQMVSQIQRAPRQLGETPEEPTGPDDEIPKVELGGERVILRFRKKQ